MEALLLFIIFGLGTAFFATQNTGSVHILLGNFLLSGIPLYVVVIASILLGVFVSWLTNLANMFSMFLSMHGKDAALKSLKQEIESLQGENHHLERELAQVHGEDTPIGEKEDREESHRSTFLHHVKNGLGLT